MVRRPHNRRSSKARRLGPGAGPRLAGHPEVRGAGRAQAPVPLGKPPMERPQTLLCLSTSSFQPSWGVPGERSLRLRGAQRGPARGRRWRCGGVCGGHSADRQPGRRSACRGNPLSRPGSRPRMPAAASPGTGAPDAKRAAHAARKTTRGSQTCGRVEPAPLSGGDPALQGHSTCFYGTNMWASFQTPLWTVLEPSTLVARPPAGEVKAPQLLVLHPALLFGFPLRRPAPWPGSPAAPRRSPGAGCTAISQRRGRGPPATRAQSVARATATAAPGARVLRAQEAGLPPIVNFIVTLLLLTAFKVRPARHMYFPCYKYIKYCLRGRPTCL